MYLLSEQIENTFLIVYFLFGFMLLWNNLFCTESSLLSSIFEVLFEQTSRSASAQFSWWQSDLLYNQIRNRFEESACCLQETVLIMAVWKEGDGPSRTINREEFKLKGGERRGVQVKNNKKHSGQRDIYTHRVYINCYLQIQQSFKFPVEWKQVKI